MPTIQQLQNYLNDPNSNLSVAVHGQKLTRGVEAETIEVENATDLDALNIPSFEISTTTLLPSSRIITGLPALRSEIRRTVVNVSSRIPQNTAWLRWFAAEARIGFLQREYNLIRQVGTRTTYGSNELLKFGAAVSRIFDWDRPSLAEMRGGEELSTISINDRNQRLRLCQVIIDYQEEKKLSDEQLATELKLEVDRTKDILGCRIEQLTVENLRKIIVDSKLLTDPKVNDILQEENNIETLQKARIKLQDEVNILRLKLATERAKNQLVAQVQQPPK